MDLDELLGKTELTQDLDFLQQSARRGRLASGPCHRLAIRTTSVTSGFTVGQTRWT